MTDSKRGWSQTDPCRLTHPGGWPDGAADSAERKIAFQSLGRKEGLTSICSSILSTPPPFLSVSDSKVCHLPPETITKITCRRLPAPLHLYFILLRILPSGCGRGLEAVAHLTCMGGTLLLCHVSHSVLPKVRHLESARP
jgi:hypothetical protein